MLEGLTSAGPDAMLSGTLMKNLIPPPACTRSRPAGLATLYLTCRRRALILRTY